MTRRPRWTEDDMQDVLTSTLAPFDFTTTTVVPNVAYGLRTVIGRCREMDLVVLKGKSFHGVEIKTNRLDLLRDKRKQCNRLGYPAPAVRFRWFAVPEHLVADTLREVDPRCGVIAVVRVRVERRGAVLVSHACRIVRYPTAWEGARDPNPAEVLKFLRLGVMRYWALRRRVGRKGVPFPGNL